MTIERSSNPVGIQRSSKLNAYVFASLDGIDENGKTIEDDQSWY